jgi:hypothetical protein
MPANKMKLILNLIILLACIAGCSERITAHYPTYDAAKKDGAIQRGWMPELVPTTATEIYEQHDLDNNEVWLRFSLPTENKDKITAEYKKLTNEDIQKIKMRYPSKVSWWFEGLIQQSPANDNALNADIYRVKQEGGKTAYMAVDRVSPHIFYWNTYE